MMSMEPSHELHQDQDRAQERNTRANRKKASKEREEQKEIVSAKKYPSATNYVAKIINSDAIAANEATKPLAKAIASK